MARTSTQKPRSRKAAQVVSKPRAQIVKRTAYTGDDLERARSIAKQLDNELKAAPSRLKFESSEASKALAAGDDREERKYDKRCDRLQDIVDHNESRIDRVRDGWATRDETLKRLVKLELRALKRITLKPKQQNDVAREITATVKSHTLDKLPAQAKRLASAWEKATLESAK